ncbi:hypothetical protein DL96DRAFT_724676 [Flagelloscypha sp. PMI_526]|nr:hypothetical protein DL96DRAFT_724676 [Flagelloscypha sp. PMI_526]
MNLGPLCKLIQRGTENVEAWWDGHLSDSAFASDDLEILLAMKEFVSDYSAAKNEGREAQTRTYHALAKLAKLPIGNVQRYFRLRSMSAPTTIPTPFSVLTPAVRTRGGEVPRMKSNTGSNDHREVVHQQEELPLVLIPINEDHHAGAQNDEAFPLTSKAPPEKYWQQTFGMSYEQWFAAQQQWLDDLASGALFEKYGDENPNELYWEEYYRNFYSTNSESRATGVLMMTPVAPIGDESYDICYDPVTMAWGYGVQHVGHFLETPCTQSEYAYHLYDSETMRKQVEWMAQNL